MTRTINFYFCKNAVKSTQKLVTCKADFVPGSCVSSLSQHCVIMPWTPDQRQRLVVEKDILEKFFPGKVEWVDPTGYTKVDVTMITNSNQTYCLRLYVPEDFPNGLPIMAVKSSPKPMPNWEESDATHTLGHTREGFLIICHYRPNHWNGEHTFYEIFMKGRLWLEAYEGHVSTGKTVDYFLGHM